ncbi:MAG: ORF6N domain-containing protein [Candidatus Bipolaricaulota bacterium]|nr:ORF6N domain-containing protein [Candidatus Bipolaricaulota bacterium]
MRHIMIDDHGRLGPRNASPNGSARVSNASPFPVEYVELRIRELRGAKVILDSDLAILYGVETRALNQAVRRNADRFPEDFVFRTTAEEEARLRSQSVISNGGRGGRRYLPLAFTEHGALMAASVLNSPQAIEMSVFIVRAFVRLRSIYAMRIELTRRLDELDTKVSKHSEALRPIVEALRRLMLPCRSRDPERLLP